MTKLICIKEFTIKVTPKYIFKIGDICDLILEDSYISHGVNGAIINNFYRIMINGYEYYIFGEIKNNFLTLAEFREQKINSILND